MNALKKVWSNFLSRLAFFWFVWGERGLTFFSVSTWAWTDCYDFFCLDSQSLFLNLLLFVKRISLTLFTVLKMSACVLVQVLLFFEITKFMKARVAWTTCMIACKDLFIVLEFFFVWTISAMFWILSFLGFEGTGSNFCCASSCLLWWGNIIFLLRCFFIIVSPFFLLSTFK